MIDIAAIQSFIKRLSKREKILFYISVVSVSIAVVVTLVVAPAIARMESLDTGIDEIKLTIQKNLRFLAYKDQINELAKQYAPYLSEAESPEEEKNILIKLIERFAAEADVSLNSRTANYTVSGQRREYTISVNCEGTMPNIVDFLYRIESSTKLLDVERFQIAPESEGAPVMTVRLTIKRTGVPEVPQE